MAKLFFVFKYIFNWKAGDRNRWKNQAVVKKSDLHTFLKTDYHKYTF